MRIKLLFKSRIQIAINNLRRRNMLKVNIPKDEIKIFPNLDNFVNKI
jgi:hypothetical protein